MGFRTTFFESREILWTLGQLQTARPSEGSSVAVQGCGVSEVPLDYERKVRGDLARVERPTWLVRSFLH